jgi:hypothetical protein
MYLSKNHLQGAQGHPAALVRTGGLPSILQQMALLLLLKQGREVLMVAVGALKMEMRA